jgi:hypothetical protein
MKRCDFLEIWRCSLGHLQAVFPGMEPVGGCANAMGRGVCRRELTRVDGWLLVDKRAVDLEASLAVN